LDVREPSELLPQYQTYQLYVRVVVLGVQDLCPLGLMKHVTCEGALAHHACGTLRFRLAAHTVLGGRCGGCTVSSTYAAACPLPAPVGALAVARVRRRFLTRSCGWALCVVQKQVRSLEHSFAQRMDPDRVCPTRTMNTRRTCGRSSTPSGTTLAPSDLSTRWLRVHLRAQWTRSRSYETAHFKTES